MTRYIYKNIPCSTECFPGVSDEKSIEQFVDNLNEHGEDGWRFLCFYNERHAIICKQEHLVSNEELSAVLVGNDLKLSKNRGY